MRRVQKGVTTREYVEDGESEREGNERGEAVGERGRLVSIYEEEEGNDVRDESENGRKKKKDKYDRWPSKMDCSETNRHELYHYVRNKENGSKR